MFMDVFGEGISICLGQVYCLFLGYEILIYPTLLTKLF